MENISVINIGMKIKKLRENANLTQKQVADYLSIDQSLVSKFEKGERSINSDLLNDIANLFAVLFRVWFLMKILHPYIQ